MSWPAIAFAPRLTDGNWQAFPQQRPCETSEFICRAGTGVRKHLYGGGADDNAASDKRPDARGLAPECPGPYGVEHRFEQQEQRDLERGQLSDGVAQTDVGQADLKDTQVEERDPLTCRCGGQWQCKRRCTKTR